jgi:hypothetical protein
MYLYYSVYLNYALSGELTVILITGGGNYKERVAVSKQAAQKTDVEKFNVRKLNEL